MTAMIRFISIIAVLTLYFSSSIMAASNPFPDRSDSYQKIKDANPLTDKVTSFLKSKNSESAKVWIFFTDKGVFDKVGFDQKAAATVLSEKVLKRRKKVNRDFVTFVDIPVHQNYVEQIINEGATHRRSSRWLNAASFELSYEQLATIKDLPFVKSVTPMVEFTKQPVEVSLIDESDFDKLTPPKALSPDALNYGSTFTQLNQINVPAVHEKGYSGAGVTLCITDTGFRKSHDAFAAAFLEGRVLDEYDFVFDDNETSNELVDWSSQWNHGTLTWSTSGSKLDGSTYGPAYNAFFLLAKTEDVRSETTVEEDNWVAALEWADSLGADVISTSLGYSAWYTNSDYDGNTATITLAANTCSSLGIVLCNSMGNSGPGPVSLSPPADAFDIIAVGAVNSSGSIASFSSRGPTFDNRMKPEVCAMGVTTYSASSSSDNSYTTSNGTSLSTPLVAGAACLLIEARPSFTPELIRLALMETADNALSPDNDYGNGIIDVNAALGWGASIAADSQSGDAPFNVNFTGSSSLTVTSWDWNFGDGNTSTAQSPSHIYTIPGVYNVSLTVDTEYGLITDEQAAYVFAYGDTLQFVSDSGFAGQEVVMSVMLTNSQPLSEIRVPFKITSNKIDFDSVSRGSRTAGFELLEAIAYDPFNGKYTFRLLADDGGGTPDLPVGSGEVMKLHVTIDEFELGGSLYTVDSSTSPFSIQLTSPFTAYSPNFIDGTIMATNVLRADVDYNQVIDIADLVFMVAFSFLDGPDPVSVQTFDVNADLLMNIGDITYLVAYMFAGGPPPVSP